MENFKLKVPKELQSKIKNLIELFSDDFGAFSNAEVLTETQINEIQGKRICQ